MLPYTGEVYFRLIAQYYAAFPGLPIVAWALAVVVIGSVVRPFAGSDRIVAGVLAAGWLWTGAVFHYGWFATINFAAPVYAALFTGQGLLIVWTGVLRGKLLLRWHGGVRHALGLVVAVLGGLLWPLLDLVLGQSAAELRVAGVTPTPTALLFIGLSLLASGRWPWPLMMVPMLWVAAGTATGWILGLGREWLLGVGAAVALITAAATGATPRGPGDGNL